MRELRSASHGRRPFLQLSRLYKRLAAGLVVLALFGLLRSHASTSSEVAQFELVEDKRTDRISLIMVWAGLEVPRYLRPFLRSVEANRAHVDLLLIAKRQDDQCVDLGDDLGSNIKVVCLDDVEYWAMHRDYLCDVWKCTSEQSTRVLNELIFRSPQDDMHTHFRTLGAAIFRPFLIDSQTRWWGWSDLDVIYGNFGRNIPWDKIRDVDIAQPTHQSMEDDTLLYLRGHMTFINNRQSTIDKLLKYPAWRSAEHWIQSERVHRIIERHLSAFVYYDSPEITFFAWDTLLSGHFKTMSLSPELMVIARQQAFDPALGLPTPSENPLFSPNPMAEGPISLEIGVTKEDLGEWLPIKYAVSFKSNIAGSNCRRFYWRDSQGQVWERCEPWLWYAMGGKQPGMIWEGLYVHFQEEKRQKWFLTLPDNPLGNGRIWNTAGYNEAEVLQLAYEPVWIEDSRKMT